MSNWRPFVRWLKEKRPEYFVGDELNRAAVQMADVKWYLSLKLRVNGNNGAPTAITPSALSTIRSSLRHYLVEDGGLNPIFFDSDMKGFMKGLKNKAQELRQSTTEVLVTGKDSLPFHLFKRISLLMLERSILPPQLAEARPNMSAEEKLQRMRAQSIRRTKLEQAEAAAWAHAYSTLSWNLAARTNNVAKLKATWLAWDGDALLVQLGSSKTDQASERCKDPSHVYANPECPEICPVLALALHMQRFPPSNKLLIFQGADQDKRFGGVFSHLVKSLEGLDYYSRQASELGTHSYRKGAVTYCASGYTSGPSLAAISVRAKWKLGGIQDKYLKYERAGDQFVGRVLSGLPQDSVKFAALPPHFEQGVIEVDDVIKYAFGAPVAAVPELKCVLRMLLASLVHHSDWLRENFAGSTMLETPLMQDRPLLTRLKTAVISGLSSQHMTATGIPDAVRQMEHNRQLRLQLEAAMNTIQELRHEHRNHCEEVRGSFSSVLGGISSVSQEVSNEVVKKIRTQERALAMRENNIRSEDLRDVILEEVSAQIAKFSDTTRQHFEQLMGAFQSVNARSNSSASILSTVAAPPEPAPSSTECEQPEVMNVEQEECNESRVFMFHGRRHWLWTDKLGKTPTYREVPRTFRLPSSLSVQISWGFWWKGVMVDGTLSRPLRLLSPKELPKPARDPLYKMRQLFATLEDFLKLLGQFDESPSDASVSRMFLCIQRLLRAILKNREDQGGLRRERVDDFKIGSLLKWKVFQRGPEYLVRLLDADRAQMLADGDTAS